MANTNIISNPIVEFRKAILNSGLTPPGSIEPGRLHRFPGVGKSNGNTAGWCKLFNDGLGGCFGDWSTGFTKTWQVKNKHAITLINAEECNVK